MVILIFGHPVIGYCNRFDSVKIRLYTTYGLIFFISSLLTACHSSKETDVTIRWENKRATGLSIPNELVQSVPADSVTQLLSVRLADKETAILGHYQLAGNDIIFKPLIPFTRGLRYTVWLKNSRLSEITIPVLAAGDTPSLLAIYPTQDSLPDNLLKIYLHFSRPMREGQSQQYIALVKNNTDTLPGVFLNLQPELWNVDRTLLTLWLDPGRIKRDLQPNKRLGAPLQPGVRYQFVVSANWPDQQGASLGKTTVKSFLTVSRDSLSPKPTQWTIRAPKSGNRQPLSVSFGESLDYSLLTTTLHVLDEAGKPVLGNWQVSDEEKSGLFTPGENWKTGRYIVQIESRLEDLAGNNLNRPFDRDITRKDRTLTTAPFVDVSFVVR